MIERSLWSGIPASVKFREILAILARAALCFTFEVPVLGRIADIFVLSLYTIGTTALLLPPPGPRGPAAMAGRSADNSRSRTAAFGSGEPEVAHPR